MLLMQQNGFDAAKQAIFEGAYAMVSGQSDDLNLKERSADVLERIHRRKTGALFRAACRAGAFVSDPSKVLKVHQQLEARVISVDLDRKRIGLSLKALNKK